MKIASGAVYNTVLMFMLREADGIFKRLLGLDKIEQGKAKGKARELTAEDVAAVTSTTKCARGLVCWWCVALQCARAWCAGGAYLVCFDQMCGLDLRYRSCLAIVI